MPNIRVDEEVYGYLNERGNTEDTFNDVIRRELGLTTSSKSEAKMFAKTVSQSEPTEGVDLEFIRKLMIRHFPQFNPESKHGTQLLKHVVQFLVAPSNWTTRDRQIAAAKRVAELEEVELQTVQDGAARRLDISIGEFRVRLEALEQEFLDQVSASGVKKTTAQSLVNKD
jgi:hypothetical protein